MPAALDDPVLKRFRAALDAVYGDRIERVVLYGSRARGGHRADSDYDVAIFLKDFDDRWQEVRRVIPIVTDILYEDEPKRQPRPLPVLSNASPRFLPRDSGKPTPQRTISNRSRDPRHVASTDAIPPYRHFQDSVICHRNSVTAILTVIPWV
jgi:predicted nucleotidyltransferase